MNNRIAITVLSLASTLMPLAAHADPRDNMDRSHHAYVQPMVRPAPVQPVYVPPVAQPVYVQRVYAPRQFVQPTGYARPVIAQPVFVARVNDRDDRRDPREHRFERNERGWHNGHDAQYGQSPRGRWQGQFGGR